MGKYHLPEMICVEGRCFAGEVHEPDEYTIPPSFADAKPTSLYTREA